jgi:hypothetical protein
MLPRQASSFTDVASTHWASPFIEYCVSQGIIKGRGAGKFDPNGNVTAFELAAMLLRAVGYGKNGEYEGASWSITVLTDAVEKGIFTGSAATKYGDPATREEAALYVFNALTLVDQVNWDKTVDDYVTASKGTIGAYKYGLTKDTTPVNGVAGFTWKNAAGIEVSSFFVTENVVGTSTDGTTIANLSTDKTHEKFIAETESVVNYVVNGQAVPEYTDGLVVAAGGYVSRQGILYTTTGLTAGDTTATFAGKVTAYTYPKGTIVKFISTDADAKVEKISITKKAVDKVTGAVTVAADGTVTIPGVGAFAKDTVVYPADLANGDDVLVYTDYSSSAAGIVRIEKAAKVTGQMTSVNTTAVSIVFGGKTYVESGLVAANSVLPAFYENPLNPAKFNVDAVAYLDDNGDIVAIRTVTATGPATKYGLLVGYLYTAGTGTLPLGTPATAKALLYTEDGTVAAYDVAKDATGNAPDQRTSFDFSATTTTKAYLVSYVINDNGEVTLTPTTTPVSVSSYTEKSPTISISGSTYYITSATKVIYFDKSADYSATNTAKFVTGYANTEGFTAATDVAFATTTVGGKNLAVLFVGKAPTSTVAGNYAYVINANKSIRYIGTTAYYDYEVYINGAKTTLTSKTDNLFASAGLYTYALDSNGYVVATPALSGAVAGGGVVSYVDEGYIAYTAGGSDVSQAINENTKFYKVTALGVVEEEIAASTATTTYTITYIQTGLTAATAIYFTVTP